MKNFSFQPLEIREPERKTIAGTIPSVEFTANIGIEGRAAIALIQSSEHCTDDYRMTMDECEAYAELFRSAPEMAEKIAALEARNAELLAAIERLVLVFGGDEFDHFDSIRNARAAIAKSEAAK